MSALPLPTRTAGARWASRSLIVLAATSTLFGATSAQAWDNGHPVHPGQQQTLAPNTHFTMAPDGSSGATVGGENIPNIDSVKKTIARYYGDPGTGIANKTSSPYISEMASIISRATGQLKAGYDRAVSHGQKPAIVFDADDTTLMTYDMEVADMHFNFNPAEQDVWVQDQRFPATPSMVGFVNTAAAMGYTIFGLTGRNDNQKAATLGNLTKDGYTAVHLGQLLHQVDRRRAHPSSRRTSPARRRNAPPSSTRR